jgi:GTPase
VRSGFATLVGRPNVGKSSLANAILGTKMAIVSDKPQTTRTEIRGVVHRPGAQLVLTDTPGVHKPRTALGHRLNDTALHAVGGGDLVVLVLDATAPVGTGDRFVAARVPPGSLVVVNKVDAASRAQVLGQLVRAANLGLGDCYPVSARTGEGVALLVDAMVAALPEGPALYPHEVVTETPEAEWVAELVREQLLGICRDELPHSSSGSPRRASSSGAGARCSRPSAPPSARSCRPARSWSWSSGWSGIGRASPGPSTSWATDSERGFGGVPHQREHEQRQPEGHQADARHGRCSVTERAQHEADEGRQIEEELHLEIHGGVLPQF